MSELIVVSFDGKLKADSVLLDLLRLEQEHLVALEDAVVVVKNLEGKIRVTSYHDLIQPVPDLGNELWGGIISAVVFHRTLELAPEGVFDEHFLLEVETALPPNASALFVIVEPADAEPVLTTLAAFGGKVMRTTLPTATQAKL